MITRIIKINSCPSFEDFKPDVNLPEFKKYNLIYGWNGSGKTSFSRVLRSFELGENYFICPERSPEFEFKLENGRTISHHNLTNFSGIRVFNKDFINDSIFGTEGTKPIFFLGKESKEEKKKINNIEAEIKGLKKDEESKSTLLEKSKISRDKILSDKARDIKNSLTTARIDRYRNYERPSLEETISSKAKELKNSDTLILMKDRLTSMQKAIQQTTKPAIDTLLIPNLDISDIITETQDILQKTVTSQIIETLKSDNILGKWVEHGLAIHKDRKLETCAFCDQTIPKNRLVNLEKHFNQDYQNLIERVERLKNRCISQKIAFSFPDTSNLYEDLLGEYLSKKKKAESLIKNFNHRLEYIISVLEQKEQNPFSKLRLKDLILNDNSPFKDIAKIIENHNKKSENFENQLDENKNTLEMHYIGEFIGSYNELLGEIKTHESDYSNLVRAITEKELEIKELKEKLISHHIPAQQINKDLEQFLGRSDIQLIATDAQEGYQITRNKEIAKDLSEGEKTALSLVYFLTKINEDGFDLESGVIVIDDPVSSLDSNAIFQAFGFIKESIKTASQIFILTHHFDFFRQVKNWFSHCNGNDREYFMMICREDNSARKSSIIKIDKLLIDYESEYHFLFSILYKFTKEQEQHLEEMYPLPNIARKFLESFLAFRVPLGSSVSNIYQRLNQIDFDSKKKERIRRFVETHSHPRYESGLQDFDMTVLGETSDILNDLLELVEHEDEKHYNFLIQSLSA